MLYWFLLGGLLSPLTSQQTLLIQLQYFKHEREPSSKIRAPRVILILLCNTDKYCTKIGALLECTYSVLGVALDESFISLRCGSIRLIPIHFSFSFICLNFRHPFTQPQRTLAPFSRDAFLQRPLRYEMNILCVPVALLVTTGSLD